MSDAADPQRAVPNAAATLHSQFSAFSGRAADALEPVSGGLNKREIAARLSVLLSTVNTYINDISAELAVPDRARLITLTHPP